MRIACALVAMVAACGKDDPGPTCEQLTDHLLLVMNATVPGHAGMDLAPRKQMAQRCEDKHYTAQVRSCMLAATTMVAASACNGDKPIMQPHVTKHSDRVPAGSGSGS